MTRSIAKQNANKLSPLTPGNAPVDLNDQVAVADYIRSLVFPLEKMAADAKLETLSYLIRLSCEEAAIQSSPKLSQRAKVK